MSQISNSLTPTFIFPLVNPCFRGPARPHWTRLGNSIAAPTGTLGRAAIKIIFSTYGYKPLLGIGYSLDIEAARGRGAGLEPCPPILQTGVVGDSSTMYAIRAHVHRDSLCLDIHPLYIFDRVFDNTFHILLPNLFGENRISHVILQPPSAHCEHGFGEWD